MSSGDRPYDLLQSNAAPPEHDEYQEHGPGVSTGAGGSPLPRPERVGHIADARV